MIVQRAHNVNVAFLLLHFIVVTCAQAGIDQFYMHGEACDPNVQMNLYPFDVSNRKFLFCDSEKGIFMVGECRFPNIFDRIGGHCINESDFMFAPEHDDPIDNGVISPMESGTGALSSIHPTNTSPTQFPQLIVYSVEQKQKEKDAAIFRQNYSDSANLQKSKQIQELQIPKVDNSSKSSDSFKFLKNILLPSNDSYATINRDGNGSISLEEDQEEKEEAKQKQQQQEQQKTPMFFTKTNLKIKKMEKIEDTEIPKRDVKVSSSNKSGNSPDIHHASISKISMPSSWISSEKRMNSSNYGKAVVAPPPTLNILSSTVSTVRIDANQIDAFEDSTSVAKCRTGEFVEVLSAIQQEDWNNLPVQPTTIAERRHQGKNHQQQEEKNPTAFSNSQFPGESAHQCRESLLPPLMENDGQMRCCLPDHGNNPLSQMSCPIAYKCELQSAENNEDNREEANVYLCCPAVSSVETNIFADDPIAPMDVPHFDVIVQPRGMEPIISSAKQKEEYDENLDELEGMMIDLDHVCSSGFSTKLHPLTGHPTICSPRWPVSSCPPFSRCQYSGQLLQFICCQPVDLLAALREALFIGQRLEAAEKRGFIGHHNNAKAPDNYNRLGRAPQIGILPGQPGCLSHQQCRLRHPGAHCQNWVCKCPHDMVAFDGKCLNHCPSDNFVRDGICTSTTNS